MTNLKPVKEGFNKYCGPAVLSILTGKNTDECANVIKQINKQYNVTGVLLTDLLKAADKLGFDNQPVAFPGRSLYSALTGMVKYDGMYIVTLENHFVAVEIKEKKIYFCDNHTKEPIPAASSARMMQGVAAVHKVIPRPKTAEEIRQEELVAALELTRKARREFEDSITNVLYQVIDFVRSTSHSIGDISVDEALAGVKKFAMEKINEL